jgi:hypothetical protein
MAHPRSVVNLEPVRMSIGTFAWALTQADAHEFGATASLAARGIFAAEPASDIREWSETQGAVTLCIAGSQALGAMFEPIQRARTRAKRPSEQE